MDGATCVDTRKSLVLFLQDARREIQSVTRITLAPLAIQETRRDETRRLVGLYVSDNLLAQIGRLLELRNASSTTLAGHSSSPTWMAGALLLDELTIVTSRERIIGTLSRIAIYGWRPRLHYANDTEPFVTHHERRSATDPTRKCYYVHTFSFSRFHFFQSTQVVYSFHALMPPTCFCQEKSACGRHQNKNKKRNGVIVIGKKKERERKKNSTKAGRKLRHDSDLQKTNAVPG